MSADTRYKKETLTVNHFSMGSNYSCKMFGGCNYELKRRQPKYQRERAQRTDNDVVRKENTWQ